MRTYTVPIEIEVQAANADKALDAARHAIDNAYNWLEVGEQDTDALIIGSAVYGEPYDLDRPGIVPALCIYEHDHDKGRCEYHD